MTRLPNWKIRIMELEDALRMFLECKGSPDKNEIIVAENHARKVLRNKVCTGWKKAPPLEHYKLEEEYKKDMGPDYVGMED